VKPKFDKNSIKMLVDYLNQCRDAYYNHDTSPITDQEYDSLFDTLKELETEYGLVYANSPTQTVGYTVVDGLNKVTHNHPLLSLDKTTDLDKFVSFFDGKPHYLMPKMDGLTCTLLYENGELIRAETRGDGEIGEDITHNIRVISNIPIHIEYKGKLIVDGECIISYEDLEKINERENANYKHPRNLVSGTVRQLDNKLVSTRNVKFVAWKLYYIDETINSNVERLDRLKKLGFEIVHYIEVFDRHSDEGAISKIKDLYEKIGYPIDGIVGMFYNLDYCESLGSTGHHPKHSMAFKFYQDDNQTVLRDIEWSTSRSGLVNPVAIFDPIEIDGTTVSRATLNNVSVIEDLQLGIGDTITVIKANQIIPLITQNLTRSNTYKIPDVCPSCGSKLVIKNDNGRKTLVCENGECFARLLDKFNNFVSRQGMNINGLSESRLSTLIRMGYINEFAGLYNLNERPDLDKLVNEDGFGKRILHNLLVSIENSRQCKLANVITAIGIPGVGKSTAKILAQYCEKNYRKQQSFYFSSFDFLFTRADLKYNWSNLPTIGETISNDINKYIIENYDELHKLDLELNIQIESTNNIDNSLQGKTFCITGKLNHFKNRADLVSHIESCGGKVMSSVTAKTTYLINNDKESNSSKNKSAKKFGTEIISEYDYIKMFMDNSD